MEGAGNMNNLTGFNFYRKRLKLIKQRHQELERIKAPKIVISEVAREDPMEHAPPSGALIEVAMRHNINYEGMETGEIIREIDKRSSDRFFSAVGDEWTPSYSDERESAEVQRMERRYKVQIDQSYL
jgi:hypothetical protein